MVRSRLRGCLDAVGVAEGWPYADLLEGCLSVIVFASGGPALWEAFVADATAFPDQFAAEPHPLDAFVARMLERADPSPDGSRLWIRAAATEERLLDFRTLAVRAGLGWPSRLGLVLHPVFGPWLGLRAACLTRELIEPTGQLTSASTCVSCDARCVAACPAAAVEGGTRGGWDVKRCASHNVTTRDCQAGCLSRLACPGGAEHRYSAAESAYHYDRGRGRRMLARRLGIRDRLRGAGPDWATWVDGTASTSADRADWVGGALPTAQENG
ncbi:MAG: hypothetical protein GY937_16105 [bacterium]|nr:hypothetical protein [bacterium]